MINGVDIIKEVLLQKILISRRLDRTLKGYRLNVYFVGNVGDTPILRLLS